MRYPKLKHPRLCRVLTYVVVIGCAALIVAIGCLPFLPDIIKALIMLGAAFALVWYIAKNFMVLFALDLCLSGLACRNTARTQYRLPESRTPEKIKAAISRFGTGCAPTPLMPQPEALRYRFRNPITVYSDGIERIISTYNTDCLNAETYRAMISSAKTNSTALIGRKKAWFRHKEKPSLNRVTVVVIFARTVDAKFSAHLYEQVCKQCGDEYDDAIIPCVINLDRRVCVFNSLPVPYAGFGYAAKNRGIRIIRQRVFGGRLPLTEENRLPPLRDADPEMSLWELWGSLHYEIVGKDQEAARRFDALADREICIEEEFLYLKWGERGICQPIELDRETKTASIQTIGFWFYPKAAPIAKKTIREMEDCIHRYFRGLGYTAEFRG